MDGEWYALVMKLVCLLVSIRVWMFVRRMRQEDHIREMEQILMPDRRWHERPEPPPKPPKFFEIVVLVLYGVVYFIAKKFRQVSKSLG
jgi:hypothetical protein